MIIGYMKLICAGKQDSMPLNISTPKSLPPAASATETSISAPALTMIGRAFKRVIWLETPWNHWEHRPFVSVWFDQLAGVVTWQCRESNAKDGQFIRIARKFFETKDDLADYLFRGCKLATDILDVEGCIWKSDRMMPNAVVTLITSILVVVNLVQLRPTNGLTISTR